MRKRGIGLADASLRGKDQSVSFEIHVHRGHPQTRQQRNSFEYFIEKCVEIGVDEITLIQTKHSERKNQKTERLEKIAISALKQSKQYWLPQLEIGVPISKYFQSIEKTSNAFIAHCYDDSKSEYSSLVKPEPCTILIGPEGDFSLTEVETAKQKGKWRFFNAS